jgi:transketolase
MALEAKMTGGKYRVYAVLGDGELNEGIVWESCNAAAKYKLENLIAIVDNNGLQNDGFGKDIMPMEPLAPRFEAAGWRALRINGNRMEEILPALDGAKSNTGRPLVIIADTVKGKGVSFMENVQGWHGKAPDDDEFARAAAEIKGA